MVWTNQTTQSITIPSGATSGARVVIDANGITEYNSSNQIVAQLSSNGTASFSGGISGSSISGSTISGSTIYTASNYLENVQVFKYPSQQVAIGTSNTLIGTITPNVPYTNSQFIITASYSGFQTGTTPNRVTLQLIRSGNILATQFLEIQNSNAQCGGTLQCIDTPGTTGAAYYYLYAKLQSGTGYAGGTSAGEGVVMTSLPYLGS